MQHISDNNLIDKIKAFELKIDDDLGDYTADMVLKADKENVKGLFVEFKSWKTGSFSLLSGSQYKDQLKAYMSKGNFEQIFDAKKLAADGIVDPDKFVKEKIAKMLKNNADEFWDSNEEFFIKHKFKGPQSIKEITINDEIMLNFNAK